jgi:LuxR family maltose regulon positive regulatory protein
VPAPLLETKFYVPRLRRGLVPRPRLSERLDRGAASKLMLVSAPAGFGKTTLLTEWLAAGPAAPADQRLVAWLSLDRGDNDPASFWAYVIAALRTVASGVGESALALLHALQRPPIETVLTTLLNDLAAIAADIMLVLDDYHVIDAREVQDGMAFLLDHLPPRLHVVIASRADPALPLARLRARGELVEIRAAELRFTPDEAAAYFNGMMGLQLAAQDVAALEGRTEGWIAALQLAALSMQGRADIAGFIAGFAGDDRYVVDYLFEEVLQRQSDHVQTFLLQTSILGGLIGPLCDAVTGHGGGKAMLEALDRGNLFLVPLDDRRRWYRYHHLFADALHARLLDEQPGQVLDLHRRASAWYEQNGEQPMAIGHALAARDFERAAGLVELAIPVMARSRQEATVRGWLEMIPDELIRVRPVLSVGFAGALLTSGELEGVEAGCGTPNGGWTRQQVPVRDPNPRNRRWSLPTRRDSAAFRGRSRCTVPGRLWPGAIHPAQSSTPSGRSNSRLTTTTSAALRQRDCWGSCTGAAGTWRPGTGPTPRAWPDCAGPGLSLTSWAARSRLRTSGSRKAVSARRCAPTSRHCSSDLSKVGQCCGEPQTCSWA